MKKAVIVIAGIVFALICYVAAGPYITLYQLKAGVEEQNSDKLSDNVDFPVLRQNMKEQINASVMKSAMTDLKDNPFAALAIGFASTMVDNMVNSFVTPAGLASLMEGKRPQPNDVDKSSSKQSQQKDVSKVSTESTLPQWEPFENASYSFESTSKFLVKVPDVTGEVIQFTLTRNGINWKLSNIIIPMDKH